MGTKGLVSGYCILSRLVFAASLISCASNTTEPPGEYVYSKRYPQYGNAIKQVPSGGFIIAGDSVEKGGSFSDLYLLKVNEEGALEWSKVIGYNGEDIAEDVIVTRDNGYVVAGVSETLGPDEITGSTWDSGDSRIVKLDQKGSVEWDYWKGYENTRDTVSNIEQTSDGGFIATGYGDRGILIIRLAENGTELFRTSLPYSGDEEGCLAESIKEVPDGYVIGGDVAFIEDIGGIPTTRLQAFMMKVTLDMQAQSASIIWKKRFGETALEESFQDLIVTGDGGLLGVGWQSDHFFEATYRKGFIVRTDSEGNTLWQHLFTGDGMSARQWDSFASVVQTADGGFVTAGETNSYGRKSPYRRDMLVVKYDGGGALSWIKAYDDDNRDADNYAMDVALRTNGGFAVAGSSSRSLWEGMDILWLKLDPNGELRE